MGVSICLSKRHGRADAQLSVQEMWKWSTWPVWQGSPCLCPGHVAGGVCLSVCQDQVAQVSLSRGAGSQPPLHHLNLARFYHCLCGPVLCGSPWERDTGDHVAPEGRGPVAQGHLESHQVSSAPAISPHSPPSHPADTSSPQSRHFHLHPHQVMGTGTSAACTLLSICIPKPLHCPSPKLGSWQGNTSSPCPVSSQHLPATCWWGSPFPHLLPSHMEPNKPFCTRQRAVSLVSLGYKQPLCGHGQSKVLAGGAHGSVSERLGKMG